MHLKVFELKRSDALERDKWNESLGNSRLVLTPSAGIAPKVDRRTLSSIKKKLDLIDRLIHSFICLRE